MYRIVISNSAEKEMERLHFVALRRVSKAIDDLALTPRPVGCRKLKGTNENLWRVREGDYRIVYLIADKIEVIEIRRVRHRKDVYE